MIRRPELDWLGPIPPTWPLLKGKRLFRKEQRPARDHDGVVTAFRDGVVTLRTNRRTEGFTIAMLEIGYQGIRKGDLVIHAMDGFAGAIGVSDSDGKSSPVYSACTPLKDVNSHYYAWLLRIAAWSGHISTMAKGIRERSTDFRFSEFGEMKLPFPPRSEQDAIVAFLDRKLEQVDRFIAAKQRLIALLQEQKTALINRAVTKGLNPDAPMKHSGIDWLGEIPAHWEVKTNGKLFRQRVEKGIEGLPLLEVSLNTGVTVENGSADRKKWAIAEAEKYKLAKKGDIAFNMMRMWQGAVGVVPVDGLTSPAYIVAVPYDGVNSDYYSLLFRTDDYKTEINRYSKGIVSDRNRLYWDSFKQMASLYPPPEEQESILDYVAAESCKIDGGIRTAEREIELIQEFRTTLISDAVRGTISLGRESNA